jgi:L-2-amino-thiazoline-4-carboxylic acid hydrolase
MDIPLIEQAKIQAQVLVPLVKALQAELGEERANALVRKALGDQYRKFGELWWKKQGARDLGEKMASAFEGFAAADALDYDVLKNDAQSFDVNVTGCRYAEFYKKIGAPELGFLLVCSSDFALAEGYSDPVHLDRTQTIMQGASHCDFRYKLEKA